MNIAQLRERYPMPWRYIVVAHNVILQDASGKELPMFIMLDFVASITQSIQANDSQKPAS